MLDNVRCCTFALLTRIALNVIDSNVVENLTEMPILNLFCEYFTFLQFIKNFVNLILMITLPITDNFLISSKN